MLVFVKALIYIDVLIAAALLLYRWALPLRSRGIVSPKLSVLMLLTPMVALFSGNFYIFFGYLALVVAFNSRSRAELAAVYLALLPTMPMIEVETQVGGVYLFAISTVAAMSMGALIGWAITSGRGASTLVRYDVALAVLVALFMFLFNRDANLTSLLRSLTATLIGFAGPYLLLSRGARRPGDLERMLLSLCLGGVIVAVTACFQSRWHWVLFETYYTALHVPLPTESASLSLRAGFLRTGGSMVDYSAGGLFLAAVVTLMPLLSRQFRSNGFWVVQTLLVGGLIATQSRGGWVAGLAGLLAVAVYRRQWRWVSLLVGGAAAAGAAIIVVPSSGRLSHVVGTTGDAAGTADYRRRLAEQGWEQIKAHPLTGQTPTRLIANLQDLVQGQHIVDFVNSHLFVAMAGGLPAFAIWCGVWLMPVIDGWRQRRQGRPLAAVPAAIIIPSMVGLIFTSLIDRNLTWSIIAVALSPACLATGRRPATIGSRHRGEPLGAQSIKV